MSLYTYFLLFMLYSFLGWLLEVITKLIEKNRFINRGFLIGPLCPIYGFVALLDYYALSWIKNPVAIFFMAILICCCLEYLVSWSFEKFFGERWWDYSNYAFNLNGRISLYSGLFFGVAGLFLVKVLHPAVIKLINLIDRTKHPYLSGILVQNNKTIPEKVLFL